MTVRELIERLQALLSWAPVFVPGLNAGFDETSGPELRTLVAVSADGSQTSMGAWMEGRAGDYVAHRHCEAVVLGRVPAK